MGDRQAVAHTAVQWAFQGSPTIGSSSVRHREKLSVVDNLSGTIAIENRATMELEGGARAALYLYVIRRAVRVLACGVRAHAECERARR